MFNDLPVYLSFAPLPDSADSRQPRIPSPSNRFMPNQKDIPTLAVWSVELDVVDYLDLHQVGFVWGHHMQPFFYSQIGLFFS